MSGASGHCRCSRHAMMLVRLSVKQGSGQIGIIADRIVDELTLVMMMVMIGGAAEQLLVGRRRTELDAGSRAGGLHAFGCARHRRFADAILHGEATLGRVGSTATQRTAHRVVHAIARRERCADRARARTTATATTTTQSGLVATGVAEIGRRMHTGRTTR